MRLASLSPAITEILFSLELQEHIVCTDHYSDYPEEAQSIPHVKDHQAIALDKLMEYEPELVFTSTVVQAKLAQQLQAAHIGNVHFDPRSLHATYEVIRQIGVLFQAEKLAVALIRDMQEGLNAVKKKARVLEQGSVQGRPKVYVEEWPAVGQASEEQSSSPAYVSGNWVPEIVKIAGGVQIPQAVVGELSPAITVEQVQQWQPDLVVLSWCGAGTAIDAKKLFMERAGWQNLQAVQQGNVYMIDDSLLNRHGPRLVQGAQRLYGWLFEMLH